MMNRDSRRDYFRIPMPPCSNQHAFGEETATPTEATEPNKPPLRVGIGGGVVAIISGLIVLLLFYLGTWVEIFITDLGAAATADVTGAQLQTGTVNLSVSGYSLPADLLGYLRIPPYAFTLIQTVGVLGVILGFLGIATVHAGLRTPTKILGVFTLVSSALLMYECYFLLHAFGAGAMYGAGVTLTFSWSWGLGCLSNFGGIGLLASGIKMVLA